MGQLQFSRKQTIELLEATDKNSNISTLDLLTVTSEVQHIVPTVLYCFNFHFIAYNDSIACVFQTMTHVFRTHVHTEHVFRVVDLPIVVVIQDTLEQHAVSIVGSILIFTTDDN